MSFGCRHHLKTFSIPCPQVSNKKWHGIFGERQKIISTGKARKDLCQNEDFYYTKPILKALKTYRSYKENDRKKLDTEIFGLAKEHRDKVVDAELKAKYR